MGMDYYQVLGLNRNANKEEIKEAFRIKAMQFHPDKHSASPKSVRDEATLRFKQASEAYQVLIDDSKRADYNLRFRSTGFTYNSSNGYGYGYGGTGTYSKAGKRESSFVSKLENVVRFLTTRSFLLNLSLAGALLGGTVIVESSRDRLWKMQNSGGTMSGSTDNGERYLMSFSNYGKSFEEAMEKMKDVSKKKE